MTRKEAKRRLKLVAEMWEPSVALHDIGGPPGPGCILQIVFNASEHVWSGDTPLELEELCEIANAWNRGDRAAALRAIEEL